MRKICLTRSQSFPFFLSFLSQILRADNPDPSGPFSLLRPGSPPEIIPQQDQRQISLLFKILRNGKIYASLQKQPAYALINIMTDYPNLSLPSCCPDRLGACGHIQVCHVDSCQIRMLVQCLSDGRIGET